MTNVNHRSNHFNLDIRLEDLETLDQLIYILRERHGKKDDDYGFIQDKITIVIKRDFSQETYSSRNHLREL